MFLGKLQNLGIEPHGDWVAGRAKRGQWATPRLVASFASMLWKFNNPKSRHDTRLADSTAEYE